MPASKSQKGRKIGRNKAKCEAYRRDERQAKNAAVKQERHAKRYTKSTVA